MNIPQRVCMQAALVWLVAGGAAAQSDHWRVEVETSAGSLAADSARPVIEAARSAIAACSGGPGPHHFDFTVSLRVNGQVREAAYDRAATSDPRASRCIRHALLALRFPSHASAATLALTLAEGEFPSGAPPEAGPVAPPPGPAPPGPVAPTTTPITPPVGPTPMGTSIPVQAPAGAADEVTIGALAAGVRTAEQLLSVLNPQRSALASCYGAARSTDATLAGDAVLHLTVAPDGHVTSAMFQAPEALAGALAGCVVQAARPWTFVPTPSETRISVPLTFGTARPIRR